MSNLSANAQKLLNIVKERPEFSKVQDRLVAEMTTMDEMEITNDLFSAYNRVKAKKITVGDKNPLNSVMAYLLGITVVKPTKIFTHTKRRTYGRSGFPDIDMDFDYARRHEIFEYLVEKYGEKYVASIGTVGTLKTRGIVRKVIKLLDPDNGITYNKEGKINDQSANYQLQNEVLGTLPDPKRPLKKKDGSPVKNITEAYKAFNAFAAMMNRYPEVYRVSQKLEGTIQSFGCLAKDTLIRVKDGHVRIDQLDNSMEVAYVNREGKIKYTTNFYAHKTGVKKCYKMKLESGDWIKVTDEHLIFTDKGCVLFEEIRKNPENYKVYAIKAENSMPAA